MRSAIFRSRLVAGLVALVLAVFSALPTFADDARDRAALDQLFAALKAAPDATAARQIDQRIWIYWTVPSDPDLALRMREVLGTMSTGDYDTSLRLLDTMIADYPTYAEAWNKRATVYYIIGDFEASLRDIDKTLQYEPRHFGALSGRVMIYLRQGKRALALRDMATALSVHPFLEEQALFPELKRDITRI